MHFYVFSDEIRYFNKLNAFNELVKLVAGNLWKELRRNSVVGLIVAIDIGINTMNYPFRKSDLECSPFSEMVQQNKVAQQNQVS